jgi:hypothetical protein
MAFAYVPLPALELATFGSLRYDRHPRDKEGLDSGTLGQVGLLARSAVPLGTGFWLGGDVGVSFPGSERVNESLAGAVLDLRGAFGRSDRRLRYAAVLGYRYDRSAKAAANASRYRSGDRLAIGASDFDALLLGAAVAVPFRPVELFGEFSLDWLVGAGAPRFVHSPARLDVGLRRRLSDELSAELLGELTLSGRPSVATNAPLVPLEPRLLIALGLRYQFELNKSGRASSAGARTPKAALAREVPARLSANARSGTSKPATVVAASSMAAPTVAPHGRANITVVDSAGHPLSDATVLYSSPEGTLVLPFERGSTFASDQLPVGRGHVIVRADLMRDWERDVEIGAEHPLELRVELVAAEASGQIRGQIRAFDGGSLPASVRIEPGAIRRAANDDGSFSVDVAPGKYTIYVELAGYRTQKRAVVVRRNGVLVLNVDLEKEHP